MEVLSKRKKETGQALIKLKMIQRRRRKRKRMKSRKPTTMHSETLAVLGAMIRKIREKFKRKRRKMEMIGEPLERQMMKNRQRLSSQTQKKTRMTMMILEDLMTSKMADKINSKQLLNL